LVAPGETPTPDQMSIHGQRREYLLPVMNRGQRIQLQYLNISKSENPPTIWLEAIHPGVTVKYRKPHPQYLGVSQPVASIWGMVIGLLVASLLYAYSPYRWLTAFGSLFFGFAAQIPGAYAMKVWRVLRNAFVG